MRNTCFPRKNDGVLIDEIGHKIKTSKSMDNLIKKITKVLQPKIGPCQFKDDLTLSYIVASTAIWIAIKEKRGRLIVDIASPVVMEPRIIEGLLETLNAYNLEESITLVFLEGNINMVIARCEMDEEYFSEEEFSLKLKQLTDYSLSLSPNLKVFWAGKTYLEYQESKA